MELKLGDWLFQVDLEATRRVTEQYSTDHCTCGYCANYYQAAPLVHPQLVSFLEQFGVYFYGPSEVMPFMPTCVLSCYRVQGKILQFGRETLMAGEVLITPESGEDGTFLLWAGEMQLPWLQEETQEDVVSPANLPEFLDRMEQIWILRHGQNAIQS